MSPQETIEPTERCRVLAGRIMEIFSRGLILDAEAVQYIDSTLSNPSLEELGRIMEDASDCESETLLEMVFFPDERLQIELEETLSQHQYVREDENKVLKTILSTAPEVHLIFPAKGQALKLTVPENAAAKFVSRLNIARQMDQRIVDAIEKFVAAEDQLQFKVRLRNSRLRPTDNQCGFLCTFLEKIDTHVDNVLACYDFLLMFFEEPIDDQDIYRALMDKKQFYLHHLQKARSADEQLAKSNMETLFMQGVRMPYFDQRSAAEKLRLIDTISYTVFGTTEHFDAAPARVDLGEFHDKDGLKKIFRMLE